MMVTTRRWPIPLAAILVAYAVLAGLLAAFVPLKDEAREWTAPLIQGGWMAWTFPTALFFLTIFLLLALMAVWEYARPGGNPRVGILRFETTRGDRLFISLLGSAFIHLAWLGLVGPNLWWALALSIVYAVGVFRFV
jgi:predicted small integral membrane protein